MLETILEEATGVLFGPGLGVSEDIKKCVLLLARKATERSIPLVFDADAIYPAKDMQQLANWTITPHEGEWKRFSMNTTEEITAIAKRYQVNIVKKGPIDTIVSHDGTSIINATGNSVLTKGGTGDILAGLIAGFVAQGRSGFAAGQLGTFFMGLAGDTIKRQFGSSFTLDELRATLGTIIGNYYE